MGVNLVHLSPRPRIKTLLMTKSDLYLPQQISYYNKHLVVFVANTEEDFTLITSDKASDHLPHLKP